MGSGMSGWEEGRVDGGVGSEGVGVRLDGAFKLRRLHVRSVAGRVGTFQQLRPDSEDEGLNRQTKNGGITYQQGEQSTMLRKQGCRGGRGGVRVGVGGHDRPNK